MIENWLDRDAYPFEPNYLSLPAGRMHYVDEGQGEPVVMIHGNPAWSFLYRHLIKRFRHDYRCVAMDHLGFGLSDKPKDWSYLPKDHAANLTQLIDTLGCTDITLVVQDWGGPIGLSYAVQHPDTVARLVILNTWAWPVNRDPHYLAFSGFMGGPVGRMLIRRYNFFARTIMRQAFGDADRLSPSVHEHYLRHLASPEDRKGCWVFPREIIRSSKWLGEIRDRIDRLTDKPALIVWGLKDIAFRKTELRRWERTFTHARSVHLPTVGHFVQEEAPEALGEAMDNFLQGTNF